MIRLTASMCRPRRMYRLIVPRRCGVNLVFFFNGTFLYFVTFSFDPTHDLELEEITYLGGYGAVGFVSSVSRYVLAYSNRTGNDDHLVIAIGFCNTFCYANRNCFHATLPLKATCDGPPRASRLHEALVS